MPPSTHHPILVYGPAYIDYLLETTPPLIADLPTVLLDQSLPAKRADVRDDGVILLEGPNGDRMEFQLPPAYRQAGATYHAREPVLARLLKSDTARPVVGTYPVLSFGEELGGMGAGYATALAGVLRMPLGTTGAVPDATGRAVLEKLAQYGIASLPCLLPHCASDTSLVIYTARGDKLAVGARQAMRRWAVNAADRAMVAGAGGLVFCGAPNSLTREILSWEPGVPVMCAPAMRNVVDTTVPLAALATGIHYLTLNMLEWTHSPDRDRLRAVIPLISVTDGPRGSYLYCRDEEFFIPALPHPGPTNTNRAGETYGATVFRTVLRLAPDFHRDGHVPTAVARQAGAYAARQAWKQLEFTDFAFPLADETDMTATQINDGTISPR